MAKIIQKPKPQAVSLKKSVSFVEKIENLESFGDFLDLQLLITEKIKEDLEHKNEIIKLIMDDIIEAIEVKFRRDDEKEVPFVLELIDIVFNFLENTGKEKAVIIDKFQRYRTKDHPEHMRKVAIHVLSKYSPGSILSHLVDIAKDQTEVCTIRNEALQCILKIEPESGSLSLLLDILKRAEEKYIVQVMNILEKHHHCFDKKETQRTLEDIASGMDSNTAHQCRAIELLGLFGNLDTLERVCVLSKNNKNCYESVQKMLYFILQKPIDILAIRPENFENLIKSLLIKLGYSDVYVTRCTHDDGVDVIAYRESQGISSKKYKIIVQCKRYSTKKVDVDVVEKLVEDIKRHEAKEGQLIVTSTFSARAKSFAQNHRYIDLIDGNELQRQLNNAFGENSYCIFWP